MANNCDGVWKSSRGGSPANPWAAVSSCHLYREHDQDLTLHISDSRISFVWRGISLSGKLASDAKSISFEDGDVWTFDMTLSEAMQHKAELEKTAPPAGSLDGVWTSSFTGSAANPWGALMDGVLVYSGSGQTAWCELLQDSRLKLQSQNADTLFGTLSEGRNVITWEGGDVWRYSMTLQEARKRHASTAPAERCLSDESREDIFDGEAITVDELFHRSSLELLDEQGWVRVDLGQQSLALDATFRVSVKQLGEEMMLLAMSWDSEMPVDLAKQVWQPEYLYHRSHRTPDMPVCGIQEVLAPGDVIGWKTFTGSKGNLKSFALMCNPDSFPDDWDGRFQYRSTLREDFPMSGTHLLLTAPWDPTRRTSIDKVRGSQRVSSCVVEPSERCRGGSRTRRLMRMPRVSLDIIPLFVRSLSKQLLEWQEILQCGKLPDIYEREFASGALGYVVVALKKCNSGPPLLPLGADLADWEQVPQAGFCLPKYLAALLQRLQLEAPVYDSLLGKQLAPYQAVLTRGVWASIQGTLQASLASQRTAYRRLSGGSGAPVIVEVSDARYIAGSTQSPAESTGSQTIKFPIRNTFLHFKHRPRIKRAQSLPAVVSFL